MIKEDVLLTVKTVNELLELVEKYKKSLEKIERYTYFEEHGLEYIRDEVLYVLDKL